MNAHKARLNGIKNNEIIEIFQKRKPHRRNFDVLKSIDTGNFSLEVSKFENTKTLLF